MKISNTLNFATILSAVLLCLLVFLPFANTADAVQFVCSANFDCGTNGLTDSPFCQGNSIYQNYRTYTCNNPGTSSASCTNSITPQFQIGCSFAQACISGSCVPNTLMASCNATPGIVSTNQSVTFSATASGGTGSYAYAWTGSCNGFSQNCSNAFSKPNTYTAYLNVTSGNQSINTACYVVVGQTCSLNATQKCVGNSIYSFDSCGNQANLVQTCPGNQTCSNSTCAISTTNTCTNHYSQRCVGNNVYWFDSCGTQQDLYQTCQPKQTCSHNSCAGTAQNQKYLSVTARNLSSGNLEWSSSVNASPSDVVQFNIAISSSGNQNINNLSVKDTLPANLTYNNSLTLDGVSHSGNITSGINIASISPGQTRSITYQVQVAPAQNFSFGTTTLSNNVVVGDPITGSASVIVTRGGVFGATAVSTGLTNNFFIDSFFLPLIVALIGVWLYKSGFLRIPKWVDSRKLKNKDITAKRKLQKRILDIKQKEIDN